MSLYIQIENGQPINHPIFEDNLLQAYPDIDLLNNEKFKPFIRLELPTVIELPRTELQILESKYLLHTDGISYIDNYYVRDMTSDEVNNVTNQRREGINNGITHNMHQAIAELEISDELDKPVWQNYIDSLSTFTFVDPFKTIIPPLPRKNKNGVWLSTFNGGSKPNVIG